MSCMAWGGVGAKVHKHLMNLSRIGLDNRLAAHIGLDLYGRRQRSPEQLQCLFDDEANQQRLLFLLPPAAECENLLHQSRSSVRCFEHLLKVSPQRTSFACFPKGYFRVSDNNPENVIEVMCDAAGQGTQRFHLLCLPQLGFSAGLPVFSLLARRNVLHYAHQTQWRTLFVVLNAPETGQPAHPAVGEDGSELLRVSRPFRHGLTTGRYDTCDVLRVHEIHDGLKCAAEILYSEDLMAFQRPEDGVGS